MPKLDKASKTHLDAQHAAYLAQSLTLEESVNLLKAVQERLATLLALYPPTLSRDDFVVEKISGVDSIWQSKKIPVRGGKYMYLISTKSEDHLLKQLTAINLLNKPYDYCSQDELLKRVSEGKVKVEVVLCHFYDPRIMGMGTRAASDSVIWLMDDKDNYISAFLASDALRETTMHLPESMDNLRKIVQPQNSQFVEMILSHQSVIQLRAWLLTIPVEDLVLQFVTLKDRPGLLGWGPQMQINIDKAVAS